MYKSKLLYKQTRHLVPGVAQGQRHCAIPCLLAIYFPVVLAIRMFGRAIVKYGSATSKLYQSITLKFSTWRTVRGLDVLLIKLIELKLMLSLAVVNSSFNLRNGFRTMFS